jgi:AraC-like DNA-binding protein
MEFAVRLDQPDVVRPARSRRMAFGPAKGPAFSIINGRGSTFEGGADEAALSLKWLAEGAAEYESEGRPYRLAGTVQLLLNRGQPYRMRMRGPSESFVLFFPKAAADAAWHMHTGVSGPMPEIPTVADVSPHSLQRSLAALREECGLAKPGGERLVELSSAVLNEIAALAFTRRRQFLRMPALRKTTRDELLRRIVRAEAYLLDLGSKATLAGAAHAASLSPFHLIRVFDAAFGETPLAYAAAKRLERARAELVESKRSISDIAFAAGYESRTAFDRAFQRRFRTTPGAVRAAAP